MRDLALSNALRRIDVADYAASISAALSDLAAIFTAKMQFSADDQAATVSTMRDAVSEKIEAPSVSRDQMWFGLRRPINAWFA